MANVSVLGAGSWGLGLALLLNNNGHNVTVWSVLKDEVAMLQTEREHKRCLPGVKIPDSITVSGDTENVIGSADVLVLAVASPYTRSTAKMIAPFVKEGQIIVNVAKGVEEHTLLTLCQIVEEEIPCAKVAVLSGPSHAEEVSIAIPTVLVVASKYDAVLKLVQDTFMCEKMRIYTSRDVKGVELGGALKNIIAFCAGVAAGLGLGDNTFAALITRGLAELSRLGVELGGQKETLYGLSGLGDLIVTCLSEHSRNRKAGKLIGQGLSLEETKKEVGMTIESIDNIEVAHELGKLHNIEMPIVEAVYGILYKGLKPEEAVSMLMNRAKKSEN